MESLENKLQLIFALILVSLAVMGLGIKVILKHLKDMEARQMERMDRQEKWLFDSLYSISPKVLLPDTAPAQLSTETASVYNPNKDPMSEFTGAKDDWHD